MPSDDTNNQTPATTGTTAAAAEPAATSGAQATANEPALATAADPARVEGEENKGAAGDNTGDDKGGQEGDGEPAALSLEALSLPEGMAIDPELGKEFLEFAASKKLTQEDAQGLLDLSLKLEAKKAEQHQAAVTQWAAESKADKEFGGASFDANLSLAAKALDAFGSPELSSLLKSTGFGNHPEVIRTFVRVGKAVGEDKLVQRGTSAPVATKSSDPVSLYPNTKFKAKG